MIVSKKISNGKGFARNEAYEYEGTKYSPDIEHEDVVKILDSGVVVQNQFGDDANQFVIGTKNGEKNFAINQTSLNVLIDELGKDTSTWVGKDVTVLTKKTMIANKKCVVAYLVTPDYSLDEFGELVKNVV